MFAAAGIGADVFGKARVDTNGPSIDMAKMEESIAGTATFWYSFNHDDGDNEYDLCSSNITASMGDGAAQPSFVNQGALRYRNYSGAQNIIVGDASVFSPTSMTFSAAVNLDEHNATYQLVASKYGASGALEWWFQVWGKDDGSYPRKMSIVLTDPTAANYTLIATQQDFPTNEWIHCGFVWSGGTSLSIYTNGILAPTVTGGSGSFTALTDTTAPLMIGNRLDGNGGWSGCIDDTAWWPRPLSAAAIGELSDTTLRDKQ